MRKRLRVTDDWLASTLNIFRKSVTASIVSKVVWRLHLWPATTSWMILEKMEANEGAAHHTPIPLKVKLRAILGWNNDNVHFENWSSSSSRWVVVVEAYSREGQFNNILLCGLCPQTRWSGIVMWLHKADGRLLWQIQRSHLSPASWTEAARNQMNFTPLGQFGTLDWGGGWPSTFF